MFIDARSLENRRRIEADICIVGAGAAGLVLAQELEKTGLKVVVLEGGGYRRTVRSQELYEREVTGLAYETAGTRTRAYGGSTNCWGGFCRQLSRHELSKRASVRNSGWPISYQELVPYHERAHRVWKLEPDKYELQDWFDTMQVDNLRLLPLKDNRVVTKITQLTKFRKSATRYRKSLRRAPEVSIILHANVTQLHVAENGSKVTHLDARTEAGTIFQVRSRIVVLAAGGIENARLLLASNRTIKKGIGNQNDLVGCYFMEHPMVFSASVHFNKPFDPSLYDPVFSYFRLPAVASLIPSDETQIKEKILGCKSYIESIYQGEQVDGVKFLRELYEHLRMRSVPKSLPTRLGAIATDLPGVYMYVMGKRLRRPKFFESYQIKNIIEPEPIRDSRITLSNERDRFGIQKVRLNWKLSPLVLKSLARSLEILDEAFRLSRTGYLDIDPAIREGGWPDQIEWVSHHMGTSRMHPDPTSGVVDVNAKVHGIGNLYIAGSSVFPTAGVDTPTLTLTALSLRLADHLKAISKQR